MLCSLTISESLPEETESLELLNENAMRPVRFLHKIGAGGQSVCHDRPVCRHCTRRDCQPGCDRWSQSDTRNTIFLHMIRWKLCRSAARSHFAVASPWSQFLSLIRTVLTTFPFEMPRQDQRQYSTSPHRAERQDDDTDVRKQKCVFYVGHSSVLIALLLLFLDVTTSFQSGCFTNFVPA